MRNIPHIKDGDMSFEKFCKYSNKVRDWADEAKEEMDRLRKLVQYESTRNKNLGLQLTRLKKSYEKEIKELKEDIEYLHEQNAGDDW